MSRPVFSFFGDSGEVFFVGELAESVVWDFAEYFNSLMDIGTLAVGVLYRQSERLVRMPWNPEECPCGADIQRSCSDVFLFLDGEFSVPGALDQVFG